MAKSKASQKKQEEAKSAVDAFDFEAAFKIIDKMQLQTLKDLALKVKSGEPLSYQDLRALKAIKGELEKKKQKEAGGEEVVGSIAEVAKKFGRVHRTIDRWIQDGMPRRDDGRYDIAAIKEWRAKTDPNFGLSEESGKWKALYLEMRARLKELEHNKAVGELLPKDEVEKGRVARIMVVKRALLAFPKIVAPQVVGLKPREIEEILRFRVEEIITQFAKG